MTRGSCTVDRHRTRVSGSWNEVKAPLQTLDRPLTQNAFQLGILSRTICRSSHLTAERFDFGEFCTETITVIYISNKKDEPHGVPGVDMGISSSVVDI